MNHTIRIGADGESYECTCGNTTFREGFYACDPQGVVYRDADGFPDGPDADSDWDGHYACDRCGAVVKQGEEMR